jgi:hypothetical protein
LSKSEAGWACSFGPAGLFVFDWPLPALAMTFTLLPLKAARRPCAALGLSSSARLFALHVPELFFALLLSLGFLLPEIGL